MDELGWTNYRLVQELRGKRGDDKDVPAQTVYQFLRGDNAINSADLGIIFDVLGIPVGPPPIRPTPRRK